MPADSEEAKRIEADFDEFAARLQQATAAAEAAKPPLGYRLGQTAVKAAVLAFGLAAETFLIYGLIEVVANVDTSLRVCLAVAIYVICFTYAIKTQLAAHAV